MESPRIMPAKLRNYGDGSATYARPGEWMKKIMAESPSPERATKLVDKLEQDVGKFPFGSAEMPPEVATAHNAFLESVATARTATEAVIRAHASTLDAAEADVVATADSMRSGTKPPALTQTKVRAFEESQLVALQPGFRS